MIVFNNVTFGYGNVPVIENVSFHIKKGEFVGVVGANGAGKTTISKLTSGLIKPSYGNVMINGANTKVTRASKISASVGFLFQNPDRQICQNTIHDEICFGLRCVKKDEGYISSRADEIIEMFGFEPNAVPFNLSRGERQLLALACALAPHPEILILDEPTTGLDYKECMKIMNFIKEENKRDTTVLMVCHDMEVVSDFAGRMLVINERKLIADAPPNEIFFDPELCSSASLSPPQIIELSLRLKGDFEKTSDIDKMLNTVSELYQKEISVL